MSADLKNEFLQLRDQYIENQFSGLNEMQRKAVFATEGPLLILAGAGSGKTTVLVNRVANILRFGTAHGSENVWREVTEQDVAALRTALMCGGQLPPATEQLLGFHAPRPWNVLAITFTNKAAGELKARLMEKLGSEDGQDVNASTFHSACVRILRRDGEALGFPRAFTIYDSDDQKRVMKELYKELMIDDKFLPIKSVSGQIGRMKDQMISPEEALEAPRDTKAALVAKVYKAYADRLRNAGAMDFDDLIYHTVRLLQQNDQVREYYQNKYQYIVVDEYQDTSVAQFRLVQLLAGGTGNVCVVGDDDQSIYRFRGATIENILNFEEVFKGAQVIRLEQNYRSTSNILDAANCVIRNNQGRKGKTLWTQNSTGEKIQHYEAENEQDEAAHIVSVIAQNQKNSARLNEHAILYRMNAQSGPIETYFARAGISYKIVGGQRFYDRKEVKDILSYMAIVANPRDNLRLRRIINEPARKIGGTTVDKMAEIASGLGVPMLEVCGAAGDYPGISRAAKALSGFYEIYRQLLEAERTQPLDEFVRTILEVTGYNAMLKAAGEEGETRKENLSQLVSSVKTYADQRGPEASLEGFLEEVALISDIDSYNEDADTVVMMTMHAAKGLEFNYVFIVGLEEGVFPSEMARYSEEDLEEERRLCYVGITRAKKELYLLSSVTRMIFGQTKHNQPSRFLEEIEDDLKEETASPMLQARRSGGWGSNRMAGEDYGYPSTVPGGRSGYSGTSGASSHYSGSPRSSYLNSEYNRAPKSAFGGSTLATAPVKKAQKTTFKPGDVLEHKVFGRGTVLKVTPTAGDAIVEIRFEKVGVKKTMANYAPIKLVEE